MEGFMVYEQVIEQQLCHGESVNIYLAEFSKLTVLFGEMSDCGLACVFISGLPEQVKYLLCTSTWMDTLTIDQLLA